VESGGIHSTLGVVMGLVGVGVDSESAGTGFVSADNSRAICVPLSRKSSHPSSPNEIVGIEVLGVGIGLRGVDGAFDAGFPGSLKLGLEFNRQTDLVAGSDGVFLAMVGCGCPVLLGSLNPVCGVSCSTLDDV
jgi:hypothetical protein